MIAPWLQFLGWIFLTGLLAFLGFLALPKLSKFLLEHFASSQIESLYEQIFKPSLSLIQIVFGLAIADIILLSVKPIVNLALLEITLGLSIAIATYTLGAQLINRFFSLYVEENVNKGRKLDAEFLLFSQVLINLAFVFLVIVIFAETHEIDILGLLASIGIGGVAVAFAAQKILEQIIGGIVLFFDSPFAIDDYIKLPDGTFGRVESIGLRLTKIRTSGKGTLVSVPNNCLTQENVENFTNAGKIMAMVHVTFPQGISIEQQALIRQVIITASKDIWGIDPRGTTVNFSKLNSANKVRAQVSFFILSSGNELSMELRGQILQIAGNKINQRLKEFGITYEIEQPTDTINLPMSI
ncbi:MAG: mechanosensitive ion channel family protein [Xenococcus sp. (in: cyanobacteria)]